VKNHYIVIDNTTYLARAAIDNGILFIAYGPEAGKEHRVAIKREVARNVPGALYSKTFISMTHCDVLEQRLNDSLNAISSSKKSNYSVENSCNDDWYHKVCGSLEIK